MEAQIELLIKMGFTETHARQFIKSTIIEFVNDINLSSSGSINPSQVKDYLQTNKLI